MPDWTAQEILTRIARRQITVEEVASAYLKRIAEREATVGAWASLQPDEVLREARRLDGLTEHGPLHGVPVGIKDIFDTRDMPTEYGSPIYAGHRAAMDAACVASLRHAGALILGKTVTTEFAAVYPGKTRNPWDAQRTPGGSSSGSAAAVADGMVPVSLGTQTLGSVIRPAAFCGAVGFKPSFGTINRAGTKPQAEGLDTIGVIVRSVADAALLTSVMADGRAESLACASIAPKRIVVYRGPDWSRCEPAAERVLTETAQRFREAGVQVTDIDPPAILREALEAQLVVATYEMARSYRDEWLNFRHHLSDELARLVSAGLQVSLHEYRRAQSLADKARQWFDSVAGESDLWMTISAPGEAPKGWNTGDATFNRIWSLLHVPAITLPAGTGPAGMPLGVQLIGWFGQDARLLGMGRWAEELLGRTANARAPAFSTA